MIRTKFRPCTVCGAERGRRRYGVKGARCDRHAPRPEQGSAFPNARDPDFTAWLSTQRCAVAGRTGKRTLPNGKTVSWLHVCSGPIDPAHLYRKRAQGVRDLGQCAPLCRSAHTSSGHNQEDHRDEFWSWYEMERDAVAQAYVDRFVVERGPVEATP